jgi:hypothetical protein
MTVNDETKSIRNSLSLPPPRARIFMQPKSAPTARMAHCWGDTTQKQPSIRRGFMYNIHMSIDQIASEALRLPARDRALLAGSLWESLADPFSAPSQMEDAEAETLALERDRQIEQGDVQAVPHGELMARLR